jgi:hypothetical protein
MITMNHSFLEALASTGPSPEIPAADNLYGWLVGGWTLDITIFDAAGTAYRSNGEAHFAWVLEGRAVQDVFINPRRDERTSSLEHTARNWYGSTFRVYDPAIRAWRVTWWNPVIAGRSELIGRWQGADVMQEGTGPDGVPIRWSFTEITPSSFLWRGERIEPSRTWLQAEMRARRIA